MYSILIVDDERIERRGIKFLLKQIHVDLKIYEASNGKEALDFLNHNTVDILFTDIKMPFVDGIQLIKEVKKLNILSKIVIFSGYEEFEYAKFATKMGVLDYILKPVNPNEFKETIKRIIHNLDTEKKENQIKDLNINFMKKHILYSLINGCKLDDLRNKTENLIDLNFLNSFKRMILIEFNNDFFGENEIDFSIILNRVLNINYEYINLNLRQSIILLKSNEETINIINNICLPIHDKISKKFGCNCYISIGQEINNINELHESYKKIELLMEKKFYNISTFVFYDDEKNNHLDNKNDNSILKKIKQEIKIKDIDNLKYDFNILCCKYKTEIQTSQIYIKFIFSEILKELYKNLKQFDDEKFKTDIDKLYKASDFVCVVNLIDSYINELEKTLSKSTSQRHREIDTVKKFIRNNYEKDLSVDELASQVCLAPSYLSYIFKKETGENISKFIKACRMDKAKDLLENSYEKIVNISYDVGYRNVSYFCQSFREYFGISPQKYRNEGESVNED